MSFQWIVIKPDFVALNGNEISHQSSGNVLLSELYKARIKDYPKFYKMDTLCKLGFVASELLLNEEVNGSLRFLPCEDRAIVLFNRSGSINTDKNYQVSIQDTENYFPSPSVFVYTLSNIVCGEIAIRNKYYGEASFYVLDQLDAESMAHHICNTFQDISLSSVLGGWVDYENENDFHAILFIVNNDCDEFSLTENINRIIK